MGQFQNDYAMLKTLYQRKKKHTQYMIPCTPNVRNYKLIHSDRKHIGSCQGIGWRWARHSKKKRRATRNLLEVVDLFITLVVLIVSQVHTYVKTYQMVYKM